MPGMPDYEKNEYFMMGIIVGVLIHIFFQRLV